MFQNTHASTIILCHYHGGDCWKFHLSFYRRHWILHAKFRIYKTIGSLSIACVLLRGSWRRNWIISDANSPRENPSGLDSQTVDPLNQRDGLLLHPFSICCRRPVLADGPFFVPRSHFWSPLMEPSQRGKLLTFIANLLRDREDAGPLADNESLFVSARLDSLSAVELVE